MNDWGSYLQPGEGLQVGGSMDTQLLQVGGGMDNFFVWCLTGVEFLLSKSLLSCSLPPSWSFDYREEAFVGPFFVYNH